MPLTTKKVTKARKAKTPSKELSKTESKESLKKSPANPKSKAAPKKVSNKKATAAKSPRRKPATKKEEGKPKSDVFKTDGTVLEYQLLTQRAFPPTRATEGAVGIDLCSAYECLIKSGCAASVRTDLKLSFPEGCYGRICPRSGLALKNRIHVSGELIDDSDPLGITVIMDNMGEDDFSIGRGDRIAQLVVERVLNPDIVETKIENTERGEGGFGSTGV